MVETPSERISRIKYRNKPEVKARILEYSRRKYHEMMNDPIKREHRNKYAVEYRAKNKEYFKRKRDEWYWGNHEYKLQYRRDLGIKIKKEVFEHYCKGTPFCQCCGEKEFFFLSMDHLDKKQGSIDRKSGRTGIRLYYWLRDNNYPKDFRVLCFNCNCGEHANKGICPHKKVLKESSLQN